MTTANDKKLTTFTWIVGSILVIISGALLTVGVTFATSYGATKEKVAIHDEELLSLKKTSVNYIYIEYLVESNQNLINILGTKPNSKEYYDAIEKWSQFQDEVLKRGNPTRGGKNFESN